MAIIILAITAYTSFLMWNYSGISKKDRTTPITSLGKHSTSNSDWVESIDVFLEDEELVLTIHNREQQFNSQGKFIRWGKPRWSPLQQDNYVKSSLTHRFPIVDQWEITVNNELKTVTYETDSYRWWHDHSDPNIGVSRGEHKHQTNIK